MIHLHDKTFEPFISSEEIDFAVSNMAKQMDDDFFDDIPVFIGVLNGAFMVLSDLMKHYRGMCEVSFLKLASYEGTQSTEKVREVLGLQVDIKDRDLIVIEDIVDTGHTLAHFFEYLKNYEPRSVKLASLIFKKEAFQKDFPIDYLGFEIENKFIVGYGLDYNEYGRNLDAIYQLV